MSLLRIRFSRPTGVAALVASLLLLLAVAAATAPRPAAASLREDRTLVVDFAFAFSSLDPQRVSTTGLFVYALYDTLLTYKNGSTKKLEPGLASSYSVSKDGKTFTFRRRKARFSDGTPVTSADVVFSLSRLKNLGTQGSFLMDGLTVRARGARTVVIKSTRANPAVPSMLTSTYASIFNAKVLRANGGSAGADAVKSDTAATFFARASAGSGPYTLVSADIASQIVLAANKRYWGKKPYYDRIVIKNVQSSAQQRLDVASGAAQIAVDGTGQTHGLPSSVMVRGSIPDQGWYLEANMDPGYSPATANPDFRTAIRYALDYRGLRALVGLSTPMPGVMPIGNPGALPAREALKQDLPRAREALRRSRISNPRVTLIYPDLTFNGVNFASICQKIKSDLAAVGITVELSPGTFASWFSLQANGNYQLSFRPQNAYYPDPAAYVEWAPGGQYALRNRWTPGRAQATVLRSLEKARAERNPTKRLALYQAWQRAMNASNAPYVYLFSTGQVMLGNTKLTGLRPIGAGWKLDLAALGSK